MLQKRGLQFRDVHPISANLDREILPPAVNQESAGKHLPKITREINCSVRAGWVGQELGVGKLRLLPIAKSQPWTAYGDLADLAQGNVTAVLPKQKDFSSLYGIANWRAFVWKRKCLVQ